LDVTATQTFLLAAASPAAGKTIREIDLRARTGATIIAVVRQGKALPNPTAETHLEAGDVLVLVGSHQQLDQAKAAMAAPMTA
ncbi:MAG TPA: TrkA C-terminal domain-containing protein, partial [Phycisphaerae bacterium]|nr:TrkA C-terminal domain-containing protein [Phycisphaerae bacterium]